MNEPIRKRIHIEKSNRFTTDPSEIQRYGGYERFRDDRPGRFAITGEFVKLPEPTDDRSQPNQR